MLLEMVPQESTLKYNSQDPAKEHTLLKCQTALLEVAPQETVHNRVKQNKVLQEAPPQQSPLKKYHNTCYLRCCHKKGYLRVHYNRRYTRYLDSVEHLLAAERCLNFCHRHRTGTCCSAALSGSHTPAKPYLLHWWQRWGRCLLPVLSPSGPHRSQLKHSFSVVTCSLGGSMCQIIYIYMQNLYGQSPSGNETGVFPVIDTFHSSLPFFLCSN